MAKARPIKGLNPQALTGHNARIIVRERLADMYAHTHAIDNPEHIQELHDLRIAAKRVRYTLEVFEKFLPLASKESAAELAKLQDELGTLHDSEVMLSLLRLALHQETTPEQVETRPVRPEKALLPPDLVSNILDPSGVPELSEQASRGLERFLRRQEQRREQCYTTFHQHWDQMEQRNLHEEILEMLARDEKK